MECEKTFDPSVKAIVHHQAAASTKPKRSSPKRIAARVRTTQTRGGARPSTEERTRECTVIGLGGVTFSVTLRPAGMMTTSTGAMAAVGDVRLTIRSSKSALSDNPLGPSASIGSACATGRTHVRSARLMMTNTRSATEGAYAGRNVDVQGHTEEELLMTTG